MHYLTLEEAVEDFVVQLQREMNVPGLKREEVRRGVKKALTHKMVFEFYRLSPLVDQSGNMVMKDGRVIPSGPAAEKP